MNWRELFTKLVVVVSLVYPFLAMWALWSALSQADVADPFQALPVFLLGLPWSFVLGVFVTSGGITGVLLVLLLPVMINSALLFKAAKRLKDK